MANDATTVGDQTSGGRAGPSGEAPAAGPGSRPRSKRGYLVPGIIALVVCAGIGTLIDVAGLQSHTPSRLDGREVETLVSQSLQAAGSEHTPPQVRCPAQEPLRAGLSFDCTLLKAGRPAGTIVVTETSSDGTLHITPPAG